MSYGSRIVRGHRAPSDAWPLGRRLHQGAYNRSAVGVLVERKTRFVVLCRMAGCTAADAVEGFTRQMKKLGVPA